MNDNPQALEVIGALPVQSQDQELSVHHLMQIIRSMSERGLTVESVGTMEKMMNLVERVQDKQNEREFAGAFAALQSECKKVIAQKAVPNNDGTTRYKFAPFEDIMDQLAPLLQRHRFTVSFSEPETMPPGRTVQVCTLQHASGHKQQTRFSCRVGSGPPKSSEAQGDGAASTYAKRFALCNALNIVIGHDDDAAAEAGTISEEQAASLFNRLRACGGDEASFLRFAGAATWKDISTSRLPEIERALQKKERTK